MCLQSCRNPRHVFAHVYLHKCAFSNNSKIKSRMISRPLRRAVWNKHVGEHVGSHLCFCCDLSVVSQLTFEVGHVISVFEGGTLDVENLRPICSSCNQSMGSMNMIRFIKIQNLKGTKNFSFQEKY